LPRKSGTR